jgi:hypothetical protein
MATAVATVISGSAAAQSPAPNTVTSVNRQGAGATLNYWTAERMGRAVPKRPAISGAPKRPASAPVAPGAPGAGGGSLPGGARGGAFQPVNQPFHGQKPALTPIPADGVYPGPNDTFEYVPRYRKYPVSTVGQLFFTDPHIPPPNNMFVCSAAVTTGSASINNIIWTAGHCVANGGQSYFYTNFMFCPSAANFAANPAVGCWAGVSANTTTDWFANGAFTRDFAYITLSSCGTVICADVATVTGGLGFGWNWARDRHWIHLGYPAEAPWSGGVIVETAAEHRYDDTPDGFGPPTNSWGSGQTPGFSGSAVILFFNYEGSSVVVDPFPQNLINSNISYYYKSPRKEKGTEIQGPYYDTFACSVWKGATGFTGTC